MNRRGSEPRTDNNGMKLVKPLVKFLVLAIFKFGPDNILFPKKLKNYFDRNSGKNKPKVYNFLALSNS